MTRPTRLGAAVVCTGAVLGSLGVWRGNGWLMLLAGATLGLVLGALTIRPRIADLEVSVSREGRTEVGRVSTCTVRVHNSGRVTSSLARVTHRLRGLEDVTVVVDALPPGCRAAVSVPRAAVQRAYAAGAEVLVVSSAPLGLLTRRHTVSQNVPLFVHPAVRRVGVVVHRGAAGERSGAPARTGLDVHGVRDYRSGDDARQVHWRSTARRGRLVVMEREAPRAGVVAVVVTGPARDPQFEDSVARAASLAVGAVGAGAQVTMIAAQQGLEPATAGTSVPLLDWCSALGTPALPGVAELQRAAAVVGPGGQVHVAGTASVNSQTVGAPGTGWWPWAQGVVASTGVRLVPIGPEGTGPL